MTDITKHYTLYPHIRFYDISETERCRKHPSLRQSTHTHTHTHCHTGSVRGFQVIKSLNVSRRSSSSSHALQTRQTEEKNFRIFLKGCIEIWRKRISLPGLINVKAEDAIRNTCLHKIKSNNVEKQADAERQMIGQNNKPLFIKPMFIKVTHCKLATTKKTRWSCVYVYNNNILLGQILKK